MTNKSLKILAISQVYYPDTVSVSQHLTDLLENLAKEGHNVSVYCSRRDYESPDIQFTKFDFIKNVKVSR